MPRHHYFYIFLKGAVIHESNKIKACQSVFSFNVIKGLLSIIDYKPQSRHELMGYKTLNPQLVIPNLSLTDSQDSNDQLRFFVKERIVRSFTKVGLGIVKSFPKLQIHIYNSTYLDDGSKLFLDVLCSRLDTAEVIYHLSNPQDTDIVSYQLNKNEALIQDIANKKALLNRHEKEILYKEALKHIGAGDPWTAEKILLRLIKEEHEPDFFYRLGIVYTQLEKTIEAEYYLEKCRQEGSESDKALANYVLAMLYARHHPAYLLNLSKASFFLEEAHEILLSLHAEDIEDIDFHRIFNRNGYALILFRQGKVQQAIDLLQYGIQNLNNEKKLLHKTVLIYNLAQCFTRLKMYQEATELYETLIAHDPLYPENYLEYAKVFIALEEYYKALEIIEKAIAIDPYIPEAYSLQGYCYSESSDTHGSLNSYQQAWELDKTNISTAYDYAYVLSEMDLYHECFSILKDLIVTPQEDTAELIRDYFILLSEASLNLKGELEALQVLQHGLTILPEDELLLKNIKLLQNKRVEV